MASNSSSFYSISANSIAVLDIGITTQKIVVLDPEKPNEPLSYQRMFFHLKQKKEEFDTFLKSLLRSYSDFGIRKFILTTTASPIFESDKETVEFITTIVTKYINPKNVLCFAKDGNFITVNDARKHPEKIISAGWKALGETVANIAETDALVVEFGTRATSLIPVKESKIATISKNDFDRIRLRELIFYGLLETNAAFIENKFVCDDEFYFLPFERHANTADVFLITNDLQSSEYLSEQGLSKDQLKRKAFTNLSKMFCMSDKAYDKNMLVNFAEEIRNKLIQVIITQIKAKLNEYNLEKIILVGIGAEILYQYLIEEVESTNLIQGKNLVHTAEINPAYSIGYLYSKKG